MIKKGFTLLEMLVVVGIIALLVGFAALSYSTVQKKARDARRKSDLKAFQNAMEQCYSINSFAYPSVSGNGLTTISMDCPIASGQDMTITDPSTKTYTVINSSPVGTTYSVSVTLEDTTVYTINNQQ